MVHSPHVGAAFVETASRVSVRRALLQVAGVELERFDEEWLARVGAVPRDVGGDAILRRVAQTGQGGVRVVVASLGLNVRFNRCRESLAREST